MNEHALDRDRLSVLTGALLLALSMTRLLDVPTLPVGTFFLGSQLGFNLSATTVMPLIMLGLGLTAAESLVRSHPLARRGTLGRSTMFWIVPGLLVTALASWLVTITDLGIWTAGILVSSVLVPLALAAEYVSVDPDQRGRRIILWSQTVLIHLLAFIIYALIFDLRVRSLLSSTAVLVVTTLLAARLYWPIVENPRDAFIYGVTPGILLGLLNWVLSYWRLTTLQGGLVLLTVFYIVIGLIQQYLYGRFDRRVIFEYSGVAAFLLLLIMVAIG